MSIADVLPQQTSRSTRGRCPVYSFRMGGETLDVLAQSATMMLSESEHDQAVIKVSSATLDSTEGMVDQPIVFQWGVSPRAESFVGYIIDVKEDTAQGSNVSLSFTMSILGASKAMFDGKPNFWANKTIPSAVRDLASKNLLGYAGHDHSYVWAALAQTGESDWGTINAFANRIGWSIYNRYGVVMCFDPVKLFTENGSYARLVMGTTNANVEADRVLLDFQPMEESDTLNYNLGREFGYFTSSYEVQIAQQPGDFKGYTFSTDVVIRDQDAARVYAGAGNVDVDRWKQYAIARVWGDADYYPGMCVEVVSTNKRYVRGKYDGKWLIRSVTHSMDRQQYQTMLSLARPSGTTPVQMPSYRPFWQEPGNDGRAKPTLTLTRSVTGTNDTPQLWMSTWADSRSRSAT